MDWEILDLDGDEIVIRRPQTAKPWGEAPSSKRMPRAAGSVNRARRCEQVQELIRFCEDQDTDTPSPRRDTVKQHVSCYGSSRKIREMASVPNLRGAIGDQKHPKPKLRLRAVLSRERSPEGGRLQRLQRPTVNDSTVSLRMLGSPRASISSPVADRSSSVGGRGIDCECYYPGVAVLPSVRNSMEESHAEKDKSEGDCAPQTDQEVDARGTVAARRFVNPWTSRKRAEDAPSNCASSLARSPMSSHRQSASDEWTARRSTSFEGDTPSTPATSAFSSVASPAQSFRDRTISIAKDSKQLDPRFFPQRGSSKMVQEITGSTRRTRLSPQASQEYMISRIQDLGKCASTGDVRSKRNGRHWPLGVPSFEDGEGQIATESLAASKLPVSDSDDRFFKPSKRDRLLSAPSVPVMREDSSAQCRSNNVPNAVDLPSARSHSLANPLPLLLRPAYESKPLPELPPFARRERNAPFHRGNMAAVHASRQDPGTQTSASLRKADSHWSRLRSRIPAPITIPERPPNAYSASGPLSPRTDQPSSPPNIPLPADPPVPPSRGSSLYRTIASHARNVSSESLVDPAASNCSTQDIRRTLRSPPTLRRNFSEYALSNHEEVPETSYSAPLSLASSTRASGIDEPNDSMIQNNLAGPTSPTGDWHDAQSTIMSSTPSYMSPVFRTDVNHSRQGHGHTNGPSPLSRQPSRSHALSPAAPLSPDQLESRLAYLERQNKRLQAALIAALDVEVGVAVSPNTDLASPRGSVKPVISDDASSTRVSASVSRSGSGAGSNSRSGSVVCDVVKRDGPVFIC